MKYVERAILAIEYGIFYKNISHFRFFKILAFNRPRSYKVCTLSSYCRSYLLSNFYFLRLFLKLFSIFFDNYVQVKVEDIEEHDIFFSDHTEVTALNYNPKIYYFELIAQLMFKEGCSVLIFFNCLKILSVLIFLGAL